VPNSEYRLRLPGPTAVPERVRQAIAHPVVSHRGPEFRETLLRAEALLQPILGTQNHVLFFSSSGTGMMEAALVNILAPNERVLVSCHGQFGDRFAAIARALGASVDTIDTLWGQAPDPAAIEARLNAADYRAFVIVHNESSTGIVANLAAIGALLRQRETLLVVDSVSGLGGLEMRQDEWGIDILVSASQKCLMCPPGLSLASVSPKAWSIVNRDDRLPRYYWDFRKALAAMDEPGTPFTTSVSLMAGLREALEMIDQETLPAVLSRHIQLSTALRVGCEALGLRSFPDPRTQSPTVVCLHVPEGLSGRDIVRTMYQRHNTVIAGSRNRLEGKVIRIGTMGQLSQQHIDTDLYQLADTLQELKHGR